MDMTKDALQYIVGLKDAVTLEINGSTYVDKEIVRIDKSQRASSIEMNTLTGLVDYIKGSIDEMADKMLIQVVSPSKVKLISKLDADRKRECLIEVNALIPGFDYDHYIDHEKFLIALQSKFIENDDRDLLMKFAGTVEDGTVAQYGDNGITQKATVKTGISSKSDAIVPNPVKLRPYRTFIEVEQPESLFIFRMRQNERSGVECAIFEADGGAWKNVATKSVKEYLEYELYELGQFTVIS